MARRQPSPQKTKKYLLLIFICLLLLCGIAVAFFHIYEKRKALEIKQQYLERLAAETYDSVFFSMYPINNYSPEEFATYRGLTPILSTHAISDLSEIAEYMDAALASGNIVSNIYLGLDPYLLWTSSRQNQETWNKNLEQYLLVYMEAYPDMTFEIMLPHPSMDYWQDINEKELETALAAYRTLIHSLDSYTNVTVYFPGAEQWLIANPANYEGDSTTYDISKKLMLLTFCDRHLQISAANADAVLAGLASQIKEEQAKATEYPDLSGQQIVFFGDSIIGNYTDSTSIPGVINGLTGASVYNFAIGGTPATSKADVDNTFLPVLERFLSGELTVAQNGTEFTYNADSDSQLCFVIHYGLNDYFEGLPLENPDDPYDNYTYTGALRTGIRKLQATYPDATVLLVTPPYCSYYNEGADINGPEAGTLADYAAAVTQVAKDMNVSYINNYSDLGINNENAHIYLADGCHLNETGRFHAATHMICFFD